MILTNMWFLINLYKLERLTDMYKGILKITSTMLEKSIIDCNDSIRNLMAPSFLSSKPDEPERRTFWDIETKTTRCKLIPRFNFHHAEVGKRYKIEAIFESTKTKSTVTFYKTKRGDKRISIQKLRQHVEIGTILELTLKNNVIHIKELKNVCFLFSLLNITYQ